MPRVASAEASAADGRRRRRQLPVRPLARRRIPVRQAFPRAPQRRLTCRDSSLTPPRALWTVVDRTGDPLYERLLNGQLSRNGLDNTGFAEPWPFDQFGPDGPEGADVP